jgi:hypothetical protein
MGSASGDVAVAAVRVKGRPAMLLVADNLEDAQGGAKRLDDVAQAAGEALTHLLQG